MAGIYELSLLCVSQKTRRTEIDRERERENQEPLNAFFLIGLFSLFSSRSFQEVHRPLRTKSGKRPVKVGKRSIKEGKRPIEAMVMVGTSVGCLTSCFGAPRHGAKRHL